MQKEPKVLQEDSTEYYRLELACKILNRDCPNHNNYIIKVVYFDLGQDWKWTTIVNTTESYQVLSPRMWSEIINDLRPIEDIIFDIFHRK